MAWPTQQGTQPLTTIDYGPDVPLLGLQGGGKKYIAYAFVQEGLYSEPTVGQIWPR